MEREKLLKYKGQAPIRFLNDFNAGLLTADEYKVIRTLNKDDAWDEIDEHVGDVEPASQDKIPEVSPELDPEEAPPRKDPITLRTDVRIAKNFFVTPNEVIDDMAPLQTPVEECVYRRLFRWSYGWQRNYCRASIPLLLSTSKMKSRNTVRKALRGLLDKGHIVEYIDDTGRVDINNDGTLYIVRLPDEIDGVSGGGSNFEGGAKNKGGLDLEGVQKMTPYEETVDISASTDRGSKNEGSNFEGGAKNKGSKINPPDGQKMKGQKLTPPVQTPTTKDFAQGGLKNEGSNFDPIKDSIKHNSKNTLSLDPVKLFYTGIGQKRISKVKRENGDSVLQELQKEGFSSEDIQFAIEWTLKPGNTKDKIHDFKIIFHTIGQALSAREAGQQAADVAQKEAARVEAEEEEQKRLEGEIQEMRSKMAKDELLNLREQAEKEIRESGEYKEQFITDMLITAKENEILRREK